jgi:hypothetical protein
MNERFRLSRKSLLMGVACCLGVLALASGQARAGTLEIVIAEGGTSFDILDNGPLDTQPATNIIQGLATALVFPDFTVVGLNASTNNPGADNPTGAVLTVGGEIQRTTAGAAASITITVTDEDYTLPTGSKILTSSASGTYTNTTAGDSQSFTSWFNPTNGAFAKDPPPSGPLTFASTGPALNSHSGDVPGLSVGSAATYSLTNETVLTMAGAPAGLVPDMVFGGSTKVLATAIPEPASLAIMLPALPVVIMGWIRHRKARAASSN